MKPSTQSMAEDFLKASWKQQVAAGTMRASEAAMSAGDVKNIARAMIREMKRKGATTAQLRETLQPVPVNSPAPHPVEVLTGGFENKHGRKPTAGEAGLWQFEIGAQGGDLFKVLGAWKKAKASAVIEARKRGQRFVRVLPFEEGR